MDLLPAIVNVLLFITIVIDIGLLVFILFKGKRELFYYFLIIHLLGISGWAVGILFTLNYANDFAVKLVFGFALILSVSKYWFIKIFPENKFPRGLKNYLPMIPAFFILIISFFDNALFKNIKVIDGYYVYRENGLFSPVYSLIIIYFLIAPLYIAYRKYKRGNYGEIIKNHLKYLFWGMAIAAVFGLTANSVLPVFFGIYLLNGLGPVPTLVLAAFILYIIRSHNFLNISLFVQRGVIYALFSGIIVGFYLFAVFLSGIVFQKTTHFTILFSAGLTAIVGIFSAPVIEKYFRRITDKIFFKDKYDYSQALHELSGALNKNFETEKILSVVFEKIRQILKISEVDLIFNKNNEEIGELGKKRSAKVVVPIALENDIIGALFIGEKLSGDHYTKEDITLLKTFSHQIAIALKKAELYEKVKNYSKELEEEVKKRTVKIEKLQEEQKQMMIDISHALQTPLTIIKGELEFLQKQGPDIKKLKAFEKTIDGISKMVYDLLNLAKLESQDADLAKEQFDLSALLEEVAEYFSVVVGDKNIVVETAIEPNIIILGNKGKIEDLIVNLLSNAVKYIANERKIFIKLFKTGDMAEVIVEDTGIGISQKDLPHIFGRFYRVKENSQKGTGLGLAICKKIVEKHNGEIKVESQFGKGTKIIIDFPLN